MNLRPFNSIGERERRAAAHAMRWPLSGYLAGKERGGRYVQNLENAWAETFGVRHAIACNSATSGLMAAAFAAALGPGDTFAVPALTMSATVAAPMFTGATPFFCDVNSSFGLNEDPDFPKRKALFITNLFGQPAQLNRWRSACNKHGVTMIEDNAQSPFATELDEYAGTIGHIGVFSLNYHKPLQCGEGGIITTNDDEIADEMRQFINHGEVGGGSIGLNLRMPEVCAAIARVQLQRGPEIIEGRIAQAEDLVEAIGDIPGLRIPLRGPCNSVYYVIPFLIDGDRAKFCAALRELGVPIVEGYGSGPLYRLPAFAPYARHCPVAEDLHDKRLFYFENSAWDLKTRQIKEIGRAFQKAAEVL